MRKKKRPLALTKRNRNYLPDFSPSTSFHLNLETMHLWQEISRSTRTYVSTNLTSTWMMKIKLLQIIKSKKSCPNNKRILLNKIKYKKGNDVQKVIILNHMTRFPVTQTSKVSSATSAIITSQLLKTLSTVNLANWYRTIIAIKKMAY